MFLRRIACLSLVVVTAALLAACQPDSARNAKAEQPIPADVLSLMSVKGMNESDPVLMRIFKEKSRLEVWKKRSSDGRYALLKSYQICRWSGDLGPKMKTGDRQAPEGFYSITPAQMNPNSHYYLSFNTGFPNAFDRAHGRTGSDLMVHGDCLSAGCYAMTDAQMAEIYAIAREAFRGGQREFQLQIFPFEMTAANMARRRDSKYFGFWKNLKTGFDHFAVTHEEPKVAVCNGAYVFDATPAAGGRFDAAGPCPAYNVPPRIQTAVAAKERADNQEFAALVHDGSPVATAYIPQDGRLRRDLGQPVHMDRFGNVPVMTASIAAPAAPAKAAHENAGARVATAYDVSPAADAAAPSREDTAEHHSGLLAWIGDKMPGSSLLKLHNASSEPLGAEAAMPLVPMPQPKPAHHHDRRTAYAAPVE